MMNSTLRRMFYNTGKKIFIANFILIVLSILFLSSCNLNQKKDKRQKKINLQNKVDTEGIQSNAIVSSFLLDEITSFVNSIDSLRRSRELQNVFLVKFHKEDSICRVDIRTNYYYRTKNFDGYIIIKEYMIAFYNLEDSNCNNGLVNPEYLQKKVKGKYKSEDECNFRPYEPQIRKYKIINGKLTLEYSGHT